MPPIATVPLGSHVPPNDSTTKSRNREPLKVSGALDGAFGFEEVTPVIGREYPTANIINDLLNAPNADELLRDLAITSKSVPPMRLKQFLLKLDASP
jgi:hypothetical protein